MSLVLSSGPPFGNIGCSPATHAVRRCPGSFKNRCDLAANGSELKCQSCRIIQTHAQFLRSAVVKFAPQPFDLLCEIGEVLINLGSVVAPAHSIELTRADVGWSHIIGHTRQRTCLYVSVRGLLLESFEVGKGIVDGFDPNNHDLVPSGLEGVLIVRGRSQDRCGT